MATAFTHRSGPPASTVFTHGFRLAVLLLPFTLLLAMTIRHQGPGQLLLLLGALFQALVCCLTFLSRGSWRQPVGPSVITLYLIGLAWMWCVDLHPDW